MLEINSQSYKKTFFHHIFVIMIFLILTSILTFPLVLDFNFGLPGVNSSCHDKCHMMWRIWWSDHSFENNLDFKNTDYIFYPDGTSLGGNLALFTTGLGVIIFKLTNNLITTYNAIILIGFSFGGYSMYLLSNHFRRNFYSSIVAGIVFTFSTFHFSHSGHHLGLSMIGWIPLYLLILFKIQKEQSLSYSILGGIFLFLISLTHLYYFVIVILFSLIFVGVFLIKKKEIRNKIFIKQVSIIMIIGIALTIGTSYSVFFSDDEFNKTQLWQHEMFSVSLENLIMPTPRHTSQPLTDYAIMYGIHDLAGNPNVPGVRSIEQAVYLGYAAIILSTIALINFRKQYAWFWASLGGLFLLISLGPELRIFNNLTGIILPERLLYEVIPGWDAIRAPARFIVVTNISLAILSSYTIFNLMEKKLFSNKIKYIILFVIIAILLFDYSQLPFDTNEIVIPEIYDEIKSDKSSFTILELPLGGHGADDNYTMSSPAFMFYQTIHEKPIIGGYESKPSNELLENQNNYFLNIFHYYYEINVNWDTTDTTFYEVDVDREYLKNSVLTDMKNLDIKYVIIHKDPTHISQSSLYSNHFHQEVYIPKMNQIMNIILDIDKPHFEDSNVIVYKIPL